MPSLAGLALRGLAFVATLHGAALLAAQRPAVWAAHRELLATLLTLHVLLVAVDGGAWEGGAPPGVLRSEPPPTDSHELLAAAGLHGGTNILAWHHGSPGLLLLLLLVYNGGLWLCAFSIVANLPLAFNLVALPALAVVPVSERRQLYSACAGKCRGAPAADKAAVAALPRPVATQALASRAVCSRLLDTPGTQAPLTQLHATLGFCHALVSPPLIAVVNADQPAKQCAAVSNWSLFVVGVGAPLCILARLQRPPEDGQPGVLWPIALAASTAVWCTVTAVG